MAIVSFTSALLFLIFLIYCTNISTTRIPLKPKRLSINLIHSNLVYPKNSPLVYKKYGDDVLINLVPNLPLVMVNFSIGNPPLTQLAILDTGSKIIWVAEKYCSGCEIKSVPLFIPQNSKSYKKVPCDGSCSKPGGGDSNECSFSKLCHYFPFYASAGFLCKGVLSTDEFSFTTVDDGVRLVPDSVFISCNLTRNISDEIDNSAYNGVFGLGAFSKSLVYELGGKFSYCISDLSDPRKSYSQLHFGDELVSLTGGSSVILKINRNGNYGVILDSVRIGEETFGSIAPHPVILDTGTPYIWWAKNYVKIMEDKLRSVLIAMGRKELESTKNSLCFSGNIKEDLIAFPDIILEFRGGGYMSLAPHNLFIQGSSARYYCSAMRESRIPGSTVLGLVAHQDHYLTYDILSDKLHIQSMSCASIHDK